MITETKSFGTEMPMEVSATASADVMYVKSFGAMPSGTVYLDAIKGIDKRSTELANSQEIKAEMKASITTTSPLMATGTSYTTTSGSIPVLFPTIVDPVIYDITKIDTPLANGGIPRVTNRGFYADYVKRTAKQTATWKGEGAALPSLTSTYTRAAAPIRFAYATGEMSGPAIAAQNSQQWVNIFQEEVRMAVISLKELEENTIINGDTTNATYTNAFNGLIASTTTNTSNKSGAELQLSELDTAFQTIREAKGHPSLIVTDNRTFNRLKQLIRPWIVIQNGPSVNFGFETLQYENVPIIWDLKMPTTATNRELLVLDTTNDAGGPNIQMRVLQDVTYVEKARTYDAISFYVALYETMIVINEAWNYRIYNLA